MLIHAKHITHVGIHNLDRFMPGKSTIEIIHSNSVCSSSSGMWAKFGGESARISCVSVQCVSQWKMRAQCRITAITWVVNLIQSIHAKCFVNTPCVSVRLCIFLFCFLLLPLDELKYLPYEFEFTFFRFAFVQPFIFTPNRAGHKVNMKLQRNETLPWMFISAWNRHCAHKRAAFSCLYLGISLLLLPFMLCFSFAIHSANDPNGYMSLFAV